jgi:transposase-like protein
LPRASITIGRKEFLEAGKKRLAGDTARAATSDEVKQLRRESHDLKEVVAEQALELRLLKKKHDRGWGRRRMRYPASEKLEIIRLVEQSHHRHAAHWRSSAFRVRPPIAGESKWEVSVAAKIDHQKAFRWNRAPVCWSWVLVNGEGIRGKTLTGRLRPTTVPPPCAAGPRMQASGAGRIAEVEQVSTRLPGPKNWRPQGP